MKGTFVSNIVKAHSWTGQVVDAKSNKFYRVYNIGNDFVVTQYGAQGNGRTGGTFDVTPTKTPVTDARSTRARKRSYETVMEVDFDLDLDKFRQALASGGNKKAGEFLDNIHTASVAAQGKDVSDGVAAARQKQRAEKSGTVSPSTAPTFEPTKAATGADRLTAFGDRALAALTLSTTDVRSATQAYADLTEELEGLQDEFRKAQSFLGTLELMVTEALTK